MKEKKAIRKKSGGFTVIEVVLYTILFSLFILLATQLFLTIKSMTANSAAYVSLQQNYVSIFSDLNQTIRAADSVDFPTAKGAGTSLSLNGGGIVYQLNEGVLQKTISANTVDLSDEGVTISDLVFENVGEATQASSIKIKMSIDSNYILEGGRTIDEEFQTAINLRE